MTYKNSWPPYIKKMIRLRYANNVGNFNVNSMTGVKYLARTCAFRGRGIEYINSDGRLEHVVEAYDKEEGMFPDDWEKVIEEYFTDCNIFSVKNMARRYGETVPNFKRMAKDYPSCPVIKDGPVWAANLKALDQWFVKADKIRKKGIKKRAKHPTN